MGVGWRQLAVLWALALALACAQHTGDPLLGVTILPPLRTTPVMRALNAAHNGRVCSTWGDAHYKTFDGDIFRFPGRCNYVFSAHCGSAYEDFNVQLRRSPEANATTLSRVTMRLDGTVIELTKSSVLVNGRPIQLPFSQSGVFVERGSSYLKVVARLGLVFMWNQDDSLLLELDTKYANQTCGLCGDFNGIPGINEFFSHDARLTPIEFGNLQKMDGPTEQCQDAVPVAPANCSTSTGICKGILSGEPFAGCNALVDAGSYVDTCQQDLCLCEHTDLTRCLCHTLAEYSRQCAHAGGLPLDWRGPDLCPQTCPLNMQYHECGSPCADTCSNREHSQLCEDHCLSGCFCPEGMVLDDISQTGCVPVSQCPCVYNGATYTPGAVYSTDCTNCTCSEGRWNCQELPCPGTCSVLGGAHFSTFDERPYTVHGDCSYVLAKPCNGSAFTVLAELRKCGLTDSETCLRSLTLSLAGGQTVIVIKASGEVFVNQLYTQLPVSAANVTLFRPSTFFVIAQTNLGLQVDVQLVPTMQVFVRLAPELRGLTCGLCGNFNQNQADDLRALSGVVEGTAAAFANTWKTQAACPNVKNIFEDPCSLSVENEKYAQHWCSWLTDPQGPFAQCHAAVSPGTYFSNCLFDTCNCEKSEDCLCAALSSYARACAAKGVLLSGWRAGVCAKPMDTCPTSMTYQYNISTCQPTCRARSNEDVTCGINFVPVDGCACPHGTFLDDEGKCVPATSCPCYYGDSTVPSGESLHEHGAVCTCTQGTLTCIGGHTPAPVCVPPMAYFDCRNATPGTVGAGCQKSCQTLDMDCYSPQCVPGCVCPDGLVADGEGGCIAVADCPCVHNEASYQAGQTIRVGCNTCTCKGRMWQCTDEPCLATCTVYGDSHYLTFDGQRYSFNGACEYTLVQNDCGGNGSAQDTFHVVTENVPCGTTGTTCSKAIKIFLGSYELKLSDGKVKVIEKGAGQEAPYSIRQEGLYLVVDTEAGLVLIWDRKTSLSLRLSPEFKGRVCGLCGNFDDNAANDFTTRSQSVVGDALEFGNSWKFSPSCPDAPAPRDPCAANPYRRSWAQKQCSVINSPPFAACHAHVEPAKYYEACVSDACACDSGGDCECFCTAVAAYAQACRDVGMCVSWRTPDVCPLFCDYYNPQGECEWHYQPCGAPCLRTCRNPSGRCLHDTQGLEGCYPRCPPEAPTFDEDQMRCVATCPPLPCQVQGKSYRLGAVVPTDRNCHSCICTESGVQCIYNTKACVCTYDGGHFRLGDVIYHTTDGTGGCISARCGTNGTIERTVHGCGTTNPAPHTTFSFSTPPTVMSSMHPPATYPGPSTSRAPTGTLSRAPSTTVGTSPGPTPSSASGSPRPGCGEVCQWSPWLDVSRPGRGIDSGDYDTLDNLRAHGHRVCQAPRAVECRAEDAPGGLHQALGRHVECSPTTGLTCHNRDQVSGLCDNYQIRVLCCSPLPCPTTPPATHRTTGTGSTAPPGTTMGPHTTSTTSKTPAPGTTTSAPGTSAPAPGTTAPAPGTATPAPGTSTPAPGTSAPAPGTATPAPGTTTPAPGTSAPAPGTVTPAPGTTTPAPGTSAPAPGTTMTVKKTLLTTGPTPVSTASVTTPVPTTALGPSSEPTSPERSTTCLRESCSWTKWIDGSYPEADINSGDFDTFQNLRAKGYKFCHRPSKVECRAEGFPNTPLAELGQDVVCSRTVGLLCLNRKQLPPICYNYEIRMLCCEKVDVCRAGHSTPATSGATHSSAHAVNDHTEATGATRVPSTASRHSSASSAHVPPATHVTPPGPTACQPQCTWTKWFDSDFPSPGPHGGDTETYSNIVRSGERVCRRPEHITQLECRAENHPEVGIARLGQVVQCNPDVGLVCRNRDQVGRFRMCLNYEVRVLCCEPREGCPSTFSPVTVLSTSSVSTASPTGTTAHVATFSTTPVPETTTTSVPQTSATSVSKTSTTPVPETSATSVHKILSTSVPKTSTIPVPVTSTTSVPPTSATSMHKILSTSVPETSTTPVPKPSTIPVPETSATSVHKILSTSVPKTSTIPVPVTSTTSVPPTSATSVSKTSTTSVPGTSATSVHKILSTSVPETSTIPVPETSATSMHKILSTSVPKTSTVPVPVTSTTSVPPTSATSVSKTSTTSVPGTSATSVHKILSTSVPETSTTPVPKPSTIPVPGTSATSVHKILSTSVPKTSTIPVPETSTTSVPETGATSMHKILSTSVPGTSATPLPGTSATSMHKILSTSVPETSTIPVPETSATSMHKILSTSVPKTSTVPMPVTSTTSVPETSATSVHIILSTSVTETSTIPVPETSATPLPGTSATSRHKILSTSVPKTSTTPVPETSASSAPVTTTTPVSASETPPPTPGPTACRPQCTWTKWFDSDFPSPGPHGGDTETYSNIVRSGERVCRRPEHITQLECRAENHPEVGIARLGQVVQCNPDVGLVCRNRDQVGRFRMCLNYEVRVLCCEPREGCPSPFSPVTVLSTSSVSTASPTGTTAHVATFSTTPVPETTTTSVPQTNATSVSKTSTTSVPGTSATSVHKILSTSVPKTSTIPVPVTSTTSVPPTSATSVSKTSTTSVPGTSATSVHKILPTSVPETSTIPVPETSTTSVPQTSATSVHKILSTSVPETSTTPVPKPSTIPVPGTSATSVNKILSTSVPKPSTIPVPVTSTTSVPPTSATSVSKTSTTSVPGTSATSVHKILSTSVPKTSTIPVPETSTTSVPETGATSMHKILSTSVPGTSATPLPGTSATSMHKILSTSVPKTSTTPVPETSASSAPVTTTTPVSASETTLPTPGPTACRPQCTWTKWFDSDFPSPGPHGGDTETYSNIVRSGESVCRRPEHITQLECRAENHPEVGIARLGQVVQCNPDVGLVCRNRDQVGRFRMCLNYEVRVLCCEPREGCPSPFSPVTVLSTSSVSTASPTGTTAHVATFSTTPVPETTTTSVPQTSATSVSKTSTTFVPGTSATSVHKILPTSVPQTSTIPVPKPSTIPVPVTSTTSVPQTSATSMHKILSTSVPETSTTPVPKPSTIPVPETSATSVHKILSTSVPKTSTIPVPVTSTTSVPPTSATSVSKTSTTSVPGTSATSVHKILSTSVPETSTIPVPETSATSMHKILSTSVPKTSTVPVPVTSTTSVPPTSATSVSKTSTTSVPGTSATSVHKILSTSVPETSTTPVPKPSTIPVPGTSATSVHKILSTSVPKTSTIPVPETSTTSVPETGATSMHKILSTSVPGTSATPLPGTSATSMHKILSTSVPETSTIPVPETSATSMHKILSTSVPKTSTVPMPVTSTTSVPETSATSVHIILSTSVTETSTIPVPETSATPLPGTSATSRHKILSTSVPKTSTTPVPETSASSAPVTTTTPVSASETPPPTPGPTACRPQCTWTKWFDSDFPSPGPHGGDTETYSNIVRSGERVCRRPEHITQLECRAENHPEVGIARLGQVVQCNPDVGLVCRNRDQVGRFRMCLNYEVRVLCCEPREGCRTSATSHLTSSATYSPTPESTSVVPPGASSSWATASSPRICYCSVAGLLYPAGSVIYQQTDLAGHCYYAVCSLDCHVVRRTDHACPTGSPPPATATSPPVSSPSTSVHVTKQGCPNAVPPRTRGETWAMPSCSQATCEGNNVITLQPRPCPQAREPTCANGYPALQVADEDGCCRHYQCQCVCSGWGDPHYITFDGIYYTFLDNCTYVLVQQIVPVYGHFRVLITNYFCDAEDGLSCPQSIIVEYQQDRVVLTRKPVRGVMTNEILFDGKRVSPGFRGGGVAVSQIGVKMYVTIPEIGVQVMFSGLIFSVEVPFSKFANNTEGQCGTCTNDQKDECRLPGGAVVSSCSDMSGHWKVTEPNQPSCYGPPPAPTTVGPTSSPAPCPPSPICQLILSEVFKQCHSVIPPQPYYQGCVFDQCHMNDSDVVCSGLELYAALCASHGACVDWRGWTNHTCSFTCPADKVYRPCGPSSPSYCYGSDSISLAALQYAGPVSEGCFCPEGMILFSTSVDICVPTGCHSCLGPRGEPVEPGHTVNIDCQECTCDGSTQTMRCQTQPCPLPPACPEPGFVPVPAAPQAGRCCPQYSCACNTSYCPAPVDCPEGSRQLLAYEEGTCCPSWECRWTICSVNGTTYQPGAVVFSSPCETCTCQVPSGPQFSTFVISCETQTCSTYCPVGFEYQALGGQCCGHCVQVACVTNGSDGSVHLFYPGESWSDPGNHCMTHECEKHRDGLVVVTTTKACPPLDCPAEQARLSEDGCCRLCTQPHSRFDCTVRHKQQVVHEGNCSSAEPVLLAYCQGHCGDSTSTYSLEANAVEHRCRCCQGLRTSPRNVTLLCTDGSSRAFSYGQVEECGCVGLQCDPPGGLGFPQSQDAGRWSRGALLPGA